MHAKFLASATCTGTGSTRVASYKYMQIHVLTMINILSRTAVSTEAQGTVHVAVRPRRRDRTAYPRTPRTGGGGNARGSPADDGLAGDRI